MTFHRLSLSVLGLAFLSGQAIATAPAPEKTGPSASVFTPEQEARIGQVAADYLLAHPDILVQVS
ncbi:DsbA family protein, partial [Salmonella enterica]|nr:DsbA family protein [Salmonella enterica]